MPTVKVSCLARVQVFDIFVVFRVFYDAKMTKLTKLYWNIENVHRIQFWFTSFVWKALNFSWIDFQSSVLFFLISEAKANFFFQEYAVKSLIFLFKKNAFLVCSNYCLKMNLFKGRLLEDFEVIQDLNGEKCHLEIRECPLKYEMFRRPTLIFKRDYSFVNSKEYNSSQNHEYCIENCLRINHGEELRLKKRLGYALGNSWKKPADFLLKTDSKLGGVLMYNSATKSVSNNLIYIWSDFSESYIRSRHISIKSATLYLSFSPNTICIFPYQRRKAKNIFRSFLDQRPNPQITVTSWFILFGVHPNKCLKITMSRNQNRQSHFQGCTQKMHF